MVLPPSFRANLHPYFYRTSSLAPSHLILIQQFICATWFPKVLVLAHIGRVLLLLLISDGNGCELWMLSRRKKRISLRLIAELKDVWEEVTEKRTQQSNIGGLNTERVSRPVIQKAVFKSDQLESKNMRDVQYYSDSGSGRTDKISGDIVLGFSDGTIALLTFEMSSCCGSQSVVSTKTQTLTHGATVTECGDYSDQVTCGIKVTWSTRQFTCPISNMSVSSSGDW